MTKQRIKMKVLLVNGSSNKNGNTFLALEEVERMLKTEGIETEIFQIGNKPVRGCIACNTCKKKGNQQCVFDDDIANRLIEAAKTADAFVFGSPVYYGQPNGALLSIIQRALYAATSAFEYKPVANIAVCRRGGATMAFSTMNMAFQMCNMVQIGSQYWNILYGTTPGEVLQDEEGLQTMRRMAKNMAWILKNIHNGNTLPGALEEDRKVTNFIR